MVVLDSAPVGTSGSKSDLADHGRGRTWDMASFNMQLVSLFTCVSGWGESRAGKSYLSVACPPYAVLLLEAEQCLLLPLLLPSSLFPLNPPSSTIRPVSHTSVPLFVILSIASASWPFQPLSCPILTLWHNLPLPSYPLYPTLCLHVPLSPFIPHSLS